MCYSLFMEYKILTSSKYKHIYIYLNTDMKQTKSIVILECPGISEEYFLQLPWKWVLWSEAVIHGQYGTPYVLRPVP